MRLGEIIAHITSSIVEVPTQDFQQVSGTTTEIQNPGARYVTDLAETAHADFLRGVVALLHRCRRVTVNLKQRRIVALQP